MEISRSNFLPVDVAISHHFDTSDFETLGVRDVKNGNLPKWLSPSWRGSLSLLRYFDTSGLRDVWMEISRSNFLSVDVATSCYFDASGAFERGHEYLLKWLSPGRRGSLSLLRHFGLREILNAGMHISRSDFLLVNVAVSRYFDTSGFERFWTWTWISLEVTLSRLMWHSLVTSGLQASGAFERGHEYLLKWLSPGWRGNLSLLRDFNTLGLLFGH